MLYRTIWAREDRTITSSTVSAIGSPLAGLRGGEWPTPRVTCRLDSYAHDRTGAYALPQGVPLSGRGVVSQEHQRDL